MLINNFQLFYNKYYFISFRSDFLKKVIQHSEPDKEKLYLTFSKPIDNYLIVELESLDPQLHPKLGKVMQMLFKFNSNGLIEEGLYTWASYR